jgi:hypothetical protein
MALFRRKKKVVKPTAKEQKTITARLQRQYPQMYEPAVSRAEKRVFSKAAPSERKELERMVGKRLKRKYKKK